jgi:hypothetical protein
MVSYSNTGYENDFFDVSDVYFNSTSQSSGSAVDLDELDARYLQKTGGTVSSNLIVSGSVDIKTALTLPIIGDVEDAIQGKQNELTTGANITIDGDEVSCDLTAGTNIDITSGVISTTGLQNELTTGTNITIDGDEISCDLTAGTNINITSGVISTTGLQNELTTGANITIEGDEISCDLTAGTNINITDGVISTTGLATTTELGTKQDDITTDTDLTLNSITTDDLIVNNNLNVDKTITYETNEFNTIVIRRFDETTTLGFNLNEFQLWVNNENILPSNASTLDAYFANWSEKDTPIQGDTIQSVVRNPNPFLFDENISSGVEASGSGSINAVIVKDIPLTIVNDIQAIVLYHRGGPGNVPLAIGLTIELYNTQEDANLLSPLARTPVIERGVSRYRYDFPSIDTYTLGFPSPNANGVYPNSITQITTDFVDLTRDNSTITELPTIFNAKVNINTDTTITGEVSCNTLTTTGNASVGGSLFLGDTNLTEDIDGLLTLDTNKRLTINGLTSGFVPTGDVNCDYLNTTYQGKFGIPDSNNDLTLSGTQINFNSDSFISNSAGSNSGNHLVVFVNGTEYKIKLENAS